MPTASAISVRSHGPSLSSVRATVTPTLITSEMKSVHKVCFETHMCYFDSMYSIVWFGPAVQGGINPVSELFTSSSNLWVSGFTSPSDVMGSKRNVE